MNIEKIIAKYLKNPSPQWCSAEQVQEINDYLMAEGKNPVDRVHGHQWWAFGKYKVHNDVCGRCEEETEYCPLHGYKRVPYYAEVNGKRQVSFDVAYCPRYLRKLTRKEIDELILEMNMDEKQWKKLKKKFPKEIDKMKMKELKYFKNVLERIKEKSRK